MESTDDRLRSTTKKHGAREWIRVREAKAADLEAMVELLSFLFHQEADFSPSPEKQRRALELLLAQPSMGRLFVLTRGAKVLGMVSLLFTISTAEGGKAAWIEDLIVQPDQQGKGLGTRLLRAAIDWARKEGLMRITLLTDTDNSHARRLYIRHGFNVSAMQPLRLQLGRSATARARPISNT